MHTVSGFPLQRLAKGHFGWVDEHPAPVKSREAKERPTVVCLSRLDPVTRTSKSRNRMYQCWLDFPPDHKASLRDGFRIKQCQTQQVAELQWVQNERFY